MSSNLGGRVFRKNATFSARVITNCISPNDDPPIPPEKKLLAAVLHKAILEHYRFSRSAMVSLDSNGRNPQSITREVRRWFESNEKHDAFSFGWICEWLDFDMEKLRQKVFSLTRAEYEKIAFSTRRARGGGKVVLVDF